MNTPLVGKLQAIAHQVEHHLNQSIFVTFQIIRHISINVTPQQQSFLLSLHFQVTDYLLHGTSKRKGIGCNFNPACIDLGKIKDIIDNTH